MYVMMPGIRLKFPHRSTIHEAYGVLSLLASRAQYDTPIPSIRAPIPYELTM